MNNFRIFLLITIFATMFSSCEKKEILKHKSAYGEAVLNGKSLFQYSTMGEALSNKYWYLPLGNGVFRIKDDICYLQIMLREKGEKDSENFWLILIGLPVDKKFPVIDHEYEIRVQNKVDLGTIQNSFCWSGELRDFYSSNPDERQFGISGLSVPTHNKFLPLKGTLSFSKFDSKTGECSFSYNLDGKDNPTEESYSISGKFNGKLEFNN